MMSCKAMPVHKLRRSTWNDGQGSGFLDFRIYGIEICKIGKQLCSKELKRVKSRAIQSSLEKDRHTPCSTEFMKQVFP
jgi:hypothetical protein